MPRRRTPSLPPQDPAPPEQIVDVDVTEEMSTSFLEYAYSVIYSRALPDARDGLKPVQRRILYQMQEMGLRPDRGHVKCARVVGDVMGKLHPHGDTAIYDTLVRMAQPWVMRVPLVDGHGNFGSPDAGPAAYRYTECRLAPAAMDMVASLDEDVVDFAPNYDEQTSEPVVLPAAFPNLLVNGASGIAVGMATNMPPHNLVEVVAAARHLVFNPQATLAELMRFVPGPDLPTGGIVTGLAGIREAYATGRGTFRMRAAATIETARRRRAAIVVTTLPYGVGPERVVERIGELVTARKLAGIAAVTDLTDRTRGLRLVIEVKNGTDPQALLEDLYRLTPLEESFAINNVALVDGRPRTLGLRDLLAVYVAHRMDVVRRRTSHRRAKAAEELHLVEGLRTAILNIDEVIEVIRSSDDTAAARQRLRDVFDLSETQATYILDMPLRRLTRFSVLEVQRRAGELVELIDQLTTVLDDEQVLRQLVADELADVARRHGTPRRTVLLEAHPSESTGTDLGGDTCRVLLSSTGRLAATSDDQPPTTWTTRSADDVITSAVRAERHGDVGLLTSRGRLVRLPVLTLPVLPPTASSPSLTGGLPVHTLVDLESGEQVVALTRTDGQLVLGTRRGLVKRVSPALPATRDSGMLIALQAGDEVVGASWLDPDQQAELVFVTDEGQLLRFPADTVPMQGPRAGGVVGIRCAPSAQVIFFGACPAGDEQDEPSVVVTVAGHSNALPGTEAGAAKVTPLDAYPLRGRGGLGVSCHRFLVGQDTLVAAWAGPAPARAAAQDGSPVDLPAPDRRRSASGITLARPVTGLGSAGLQ